MTLPFRHRDLWSTAHVKAQLANGPMSEGKTFLYFLGITAFDWLQFTALRLSAQRGPVPAWEHFNAWFAFAVTVVGVGYLFLCNGGPRGSHFLYRYFPLSVVVGWKFVAASLAALPVVNAALSGTSASTAGWTLSAAAVALNLAMFLRIGNHLKGLNLSAGAQHRSYPTDAIKEGVRVWPN